MYVTAYICDVLVYIVHVSLTSFARGCVQLPGFVSTVWKVLGPWATLPTKIYTPPHIDLNMDPRWVHK